MIITGCATVISHVICAATVTSVTTTELLCSCDLNAVVTVWSVHFQEACGCRQLWMCSTRSLPQQTAPLSTGQMWCAHPTWAPALQKHRRAWLLKLQTLSLGLSRSAPPCHPPPPPLLLSHPLVGHPPHSLNFACNKSRVVVLSLPFILVFALDGDWDSAPLLMPAKTCWHSGDACACAAVGNCSRFWVLIGQQAVSL